MSELKPARRPGPECCAPRWHRATVCGMTAAKISISVPDDLAAELATMPNVSGFIAQAIRDRLERDRLKSMFREHGITLTEDGIGRMRERVHALRKRGRLERDAEPAAGTRQAAA